ncbi:hypothetical protein FRC03_005886 [Tulasnella sp. 419]|nr:hypothetical protein FRC03_005886 [Tulasnella sp. 419]
MTKASRKFVDLIFTAATKHPNWDPVVPVQVGDYGKVDKETGIFTRYGNLYDQQNIAKWPWLADFPPVTAPVEDKMVVSSLNAKSYGVEFTPTANLAGLVDVGIGGSWKFGQSDRGALLIMCRPRQQYIPREIPFELLLRVDVLRGYSWVESVFTCPGYAMYLSTKGGDTISVSLKASAPIPAAPAVAIGAEIAATWERTNVAGLYRDAWNANGDYVFTPLFHLKKWRRREIWNGILMRDSPPPPLEGLDNLEDEEVPWEDLDSEGEEYEDE